MDYAIIDLHRELALVSAQIKELEEIAGPTVNVDVAADATAIFMLLKMKEEGLSAQIKAASYKERSIPLVPAPVAVKAEEWAAQAAAWQKEYEARHGRLIDRIAASAAKEQTGTESAEGKLWSETLPEFAKWVLDQRTAGNIAGSERQAVLSTAKKFFTISKTGQKKPLNGDSAWSSYRSQQNANAGRRYLKPSPKKTFS